MAVKVRRKRIQAELRSGDKVAIPAWVVESGKPGPCLLLVAAQHGNEVQGAEVIRRFVDLCKTRLACGKVFAVPMGNPIAIRERRPHIGMKPEQPYGFSRVWNMNLRWPGRRTGNTPARLAYALHQAFGDEATHAMDLHCWNKHWAPAVLVPDMPGMRELAGKLGDRFVTMRGMGTVTLGGYFCTTGRPGVSYEFSGQYMMDERQIRRGMRLVTNMAKAIGIMSGALRKGDVPVLFSDRCAKVEVGAPCSGLFVKTPIELGAPVRKGDGLGHVLSDRDLTCHEVRTPRAGYLQSLGAARDNCDVAMPGHHPYVTRRERVAIIVFPKR